MKAHLKAIRWVLLPSIFLYLVISIVMLDFKTPLHWFMMTDKIGITVRLITLGLETIFYLVLVTYYKNDNQPLSFWEWLNK